MGIKLAWLANTRPDLTFGISQKAQVIRAMFQQGSPKHYKRLNKAIKNAHDNRESICIPKLNLDTHRVVAYSNAAFANNIDISSDLGEYYFSLTSLTKRYQSHISHENPNVSLTLCYQQNSLHSQILPTTH